MGDRMFERRQRSSLKAVSALLILAGCTSTPKAQQEETPAAAKESAPAAETPAENLSAQQQQVLSDYKAEMEIGRTMSGRLLAFYGFVQDKKFTDYLNQVGNYVAKAGDYPNRKYMFMILDTDQVNAFACPGGYILVTRGTIANARNEAELAAILGHESAHVGLQHMFNTLKRMNKDDADILAKQTELRRNADPFLRSRQRPVPEENESGSALAKFLTTASGAGLGILQAAKAGMSLMMDKGLDQRLEFEADREGVKYAVRAGYEPHALDHFLARLQEEKQKKEANSDVLDKTHPPIPDRRKAIALALSKMNADQITGAVLQTRFEGFQSRLSSKKSNAKDKGDKGEETPNANSDSDKQDEKESGA